MSEFVKQLSQMLQRYDVDVRELQAAIRKLPTSERPAAQTHANVKEAAASEIRQIMLRCGIKEVRRP